MVEILIFNIQGCTCCILVNKRRLWSYQGYQMTGRTEGASIIKIVLINRDIEGPLAGVIITILLGP